MKRKKNLFSVLSVRIWLLACFLLVGSSSLFAQEIVAIEDADPVEAMPVDTLLSGQILRDSMEVRELRQDIIPQDSMMYEVILPDSTIQEAYLVADSVFTEAPKPTGKPKDTFKPSSKKAVLYAAIFPGLGQIYNRKYWKLPLVYGGYMGFMYAITWNNRMYSDYFSAYKDLVNDYANNLEDPSKWSSSWTDLVRSGDYETFINNTNNQDLLKRRKDYYRRYRDLSIILAVGFYAICIIDAYVDAELFDFDISSDLSMRIDPMVMPRTSLNNWSFGLNCSITF